MSHTIYQIGDNLNWDLVTRQTLVRQNSEDPYSVINPISFTLESKLVMLGCKSLTAKNTWRLGCWANFRLLVSPSSTSQYISAVEFFSKACRLNRLTLIEVPPIEPWPYLLYVDFPRWMITIDVEIWRYSGSADDSTEQILNRIESKIDAL